MEVFNEVASFHFIALALGYSIGVKFRAFRQATEVST